MLNAWVLKSVNGSIGVGFFHSTMRNNPMHSRTTNNAGSCAVFQPRSPQAITRYVSRDRLMIDVVCPKTSKFLLAWGTRLGMKDIVRMASMPMMGILTQNAARHPVVETSTPPMIGPSAAAMPPAAPHNPIIFARSLKLIQAFLNRPLTTR